MLCLAMATPRRRPSDRPRPRLVRAIAIAAIATLPLMGCGADAGPDPVLVLDGSVATDFGALATLTFDEFIAYAPAVAPCIGTVRLAAATELDELAYYSADTATITVRVPATAPSLRDSLVHELAHHVEASCVSHEPMRADFLAAQGHEPDQDWFAASTWENTPSEQFAEAVVEHVLGERQRNLARIRLAPAALAIVAEWMSPDTAQPASGD